jgi:uroporphyrin-III C-methyltransferase/precorrin-2 dehydrogenase/sirohydrochlorin ferrochelatase
LIVDLKTLPALVQSNDIKAPTLIIVGDVVKLHEKLHWFKPESELEAKAVETFGKGGM